MRQESWRRYAGGSSEHRRDREGRRLRAEGQHGAHPQKRQSARFRAELEQEQYWSKNNYVGTSWTFMPKRYVVTELDGGIFLQGDLISPKGGTTDTNVFIVFDEWKCGS
jgi:hypothetical protein